MTISGSGEQTNNLNVQDNGNNLKPVWEAPDAVGLYLPTQERDACGVGFIAAIDGHRTHKILQNAQTLSLRMNHRGACACDNDTGDGAGVLTAIPHGFYSSVLQALDPPVVLPPAGRYATGVFFLDRASHAVTERKVADLASQLELSVLTWRTVPTRNASIGQVARNTEPYMRQIFVVPNNTNITDEEFEKKIFVMRKRASHEIPKPGSRFYICSLSIRVIVYKGQFTAEQLWGYFLDLEDPSFETYLALVHTRFSTNTFPSWERAHPLRMLAHNGEINTLRGNVNFMKAREGVMSSDIFSKDELSKLYPVVEPGLSDSGAADCVLEWLVQLGGKNLPEAVMTMVPEAWANDPTMPAYKRAFYKWSACSMEPWDGPALISFTDGRYVGAVLDRNGLRPSRFYITKDNIMVMASEVGVYDVAPENVVLKSRLKPGRMLLVDTKEGRVIEDVELKRQIAEARPHAEWLKEQISLEDIHNAHKSSGRNYENLLAPSGLTDPRLTLFGYTPETIRMLLLPMLTTGKEALGSMGNDAPLACLSNFSPLTYDYFKQLFAQVTNPPIDPFRERCVMSLQSPIGPEANTLCPSVKQTHRLWLTRPILSPSDLHVLEHTNHRGWKSAVLDTTWPIDAGPQGLTQNLSRLCKEADDAALISNCQILILSDRKSGPDRIPMGSLITLGAVHHHLIETRRRMCVALIVHTAEAREVHQICLLIGYGADAVCSYLPIELAASLRNDGVLIDSTLTDEVLCENYARSMETGIAKVMAKMGISTLQSYKGAQIFEAVGLAEDVIDKCFRGTPSRIGGATLETIGAEAISRHQLAYNQTINALVLRNPGIYHWRAGGERHVNEPAAVATLREAAQTNSRSAYEKFKEATMSSIQACTLRGQLELVTLDQPIPLTDVEPAAEIVKRFATGAMSLGSISAETHETLAIAMNKVGAKSNTGEGGEIQERFLDPKICSAIKQVASGRFGVTAAYLAHADDLQIKMAQGAKPGEGGELPGHKVTKEIARTRHSVPGVGLVSPPPHHDIYSIEDLAELIYDLKCANPKARISVKLVSEVGVGVVASGVAKGKAEHIVISGHDGGTGASSWTGIKHAGLPWELGIAETHQTLVLNNLRSRIVLQADGQIRTGFDVIIAALLGADEFGFSTAPLIALGCTMMRKCHLNTCPVGIATQDPVLRKKFAGHPEHVLNYLFLLAEEVRQHMAAIGITKFQDLVGRTDLLRASTDPAAGPKARLLNLSPLLQNALHLRPGACIIGGSIPQDFQLERRLDCRLIELCTPVIEGLKDSIDIEMGIHNEARTFASTLSYHIALKYSDSGLPKNRSINIRLNGSAGQSFCAFLVAGVHVTLEGDANDYVGKGLSGGTVIIYPPKGSQFASHLNVIVGNVCLYGATSGHAYFRGIASERFAVRNSGAIAVVEGVGDHGCEYMTGGTVLILGLTGRNFAAGMSGGIAYVWDIDGSFKGKCNHETVELLPIKEQDDINLILKLLKEFRQLTGSIIAQDLLDKWPAPLTEFIKVFPYEYQRALRTQAQNSVPEVVKPPSVEPRVQDIEDTITDVIQEGVRVERALDKVRGFMKYSREPAPYRPADKRLRDWDEVYNSSHVRKGLRVQAARCMECGVPFCQSDAHGCPLGNLIPKWNLLVFHSQWRQALKHLLQTNNFPEFTGRVCPAPCEAACVLGISEPAVTIKNIECAIIDSAFENGLIVAEPPLTRTGKRIAVVGSGPAGLAAAHQLNKVGHNVTVFERNDRCGGLLQYGIPSMKLNKSVVARRVNLLQEEGIVFKVNVNVGADINAEELSDEYDALILTTGAAWPRDLPIPGRQLNGIHFAMEFLESWQKRQLGAPAQGPPPAKDKHVIVIGGGDTGCDCVATSLRQGAASVTAFEILPEPPKERSKDNPWPQWPRTFRIDYGHEEVKTRWGKDPRRYSTLAQEFVNDGQGNVIGIRAADVDWEKDAAGRWSMKPREGSERVHKADLVLLALGFLGPERALSTQLGLPLDARGNFDAKNYQVRQNVFAAGDCRRGQSLVVWAIAEGRQCARTVDTFLQGTSTLPGPGGVILESVD